MLPLLKLLLISNELIIELVTVIFVSSRKTSLKKLDFTQSLCWFLLPHPL